MTVEKALNLKIPAEFGQDEEDWDDMNGSISFVADQLSENDEFRTGASRFVIIGKEDYVIKIPFNGMFCYDEDDYDEEAGEYSQMRFVEFTGCADYCAREAILYEEAVEAGCGKIFADTIYAGCTRDGSSEIYKQEKIFTTYGDDETERTPSAKSSATVRSNRVDSYKWRKFPDDWLALAIDWYGEEMVKNLIDFSVALEDLHYENIGYRFDGSPVIFDYAGWSD